MHVIEREWGMGERERERVIRMLRCLFLFSFSMFCLINKSIERGTNGPM